MTEACGNCLFFRPHHPETRALIEQFKVSGDACSVEHYRDGRCHRHPRDGGSVIEFPKTYAGDWCGEYEPAGPRRTKSDAAPGN